MRIISAAVVGLSLSLSAAAAAQDQDAASKKSVPSAKSFVDADRTPEAVAKGLQTLVDTRAVYRKSAAVTERIKLSIVTPDGVQEMAVASDYDASGFRITIDDQMTLVGLDDEVYMSMSPEK